LLTGNAECKLLFIVTSIGAVSKKEMIDMLSDEKSEQLEALREVIIMGETSVSNFRTYENLLESGRGIKNTFLGARMKLVDTHDVCNLQFTSGTTGNPKAAMLTHR
jgi:long-subunit acyl-CoA synthetase (AMP-forming)